MPQPGSGSVADWYAAGDVKPREIDPNPRCYECKSPDPMGRAPVFHPAHRWGPCEVRMPGGDECGCTAGVQQQ